MFVKELSLRDFRSYEQVSVAFPAGVSALIGSNGQGKTNLVEAIAYVATLGSHRVATDAPLIRRDASSATVRVVASHANRDIELQIEIEAQRPNKATFNRSPLKRPRDLLGYLNVVVFAPEDLALVKGDPSARRHFLDQTLVALSPRLAATRSDLDRVLKQRNALLKTAQHAARRSASDVMHTLDAWDAQFARLSAQLALQRLALIDSLLPHTQAHYSMVSDDRGPF
jgi:DNA replication and repair protein RecF